MASEPSAISEPGHCRFISRNGNHLSRFDALGDQLATLLDVDDAILDGEMIATDDSGRPQFYELLRRTQAPAYVAFDLLWADGADLRTLPLSRAVSACAAFCQPTQPALPRRCQSLAEGASSSR